MRVPDEALANVRERGYAVVEGFLDKDTLEAARNALWDIYPKPEQYFADRSAFPEYGKSQVAGLKVFPYPSWDLNRLAVYPDLLDAAERFCGTSEIDCYLIELWAKYARSVNYDQQLHRDYHNHTIVAPRADQMGAQMTTFIILSDVGEQDSPTKVVPLDKTKDIPIGICLMEKGEFLDKEVTITAPAGSLFIYRTDVFHRGSDFLADERSRFIIAVGFKPRGWGWQGKIAWPEQAVRKGWTESMVRMTPRERDVFGWPSPCDPYWNEQTLSDVAMRYPGIDLTPYGAPVRESAAA